MRLDEVDLCEINYLGSSLILTFVSQQASALGSHREEPCFSNQSLRLSPVMEQAKAVFIRHYSKPISDGPW